MTHVAKLGPDLSPFGPIVYDASPAPPVVPTPAPLPVRPPFADDSVEDDNND